MPESESSGALVSFATLGAFSTAQQVAGTLLSSVEGADPALVAEESMSLLAVVTGRALRERPLAARILADLPLTWRDYVVGGAMLRDDDPESVTQREAESYEQIGRKLAFYQAHFPPEQIPGPRLLKDKMELWMGRVSPPGLPEPPFERLARLGLVDMVVTHVRLVRAFLESEEATDGATDAS